MIEYNRWIERQRRIEHNLRLQRENQDELRNPRRGPFVYTAQLLQVPEGVERISRSLVLDIEESGVRFRFDIIQVYNDHVTWAVTASWPGQ